MAEIVREELTEREAAIAEGTKEIVTFLFKQDDPGLYSRVYAGAAMGVLRTLRDEAGLQQCIAYCNSYLKEIKDESTSAT